MSNSVSPAVRAQPAPQPPPAPKPSQGTAKSAPPAANDTVQISNAARSLQQTIANPPQTPQSAAKGDVQAQQLLDKEAGEKVG